MKRAQITFCIRVRGAWAAAALLRHRDRFLWVRLLPREERYLRFVEQKNAYRVQELRRYADMPAKLSAYVGLTDREKSVLMSSVVMAAGEYGYYDAGVLRNSGFRRTM